MLGRGEGRLRMFKGNEFDFGAVICEDCYRRLGEMEGRDNSLGMLVFLWLVRGLVKSLFL